MEYVRAALGFERAHTVAAGDGVNDLLMLQQVILSADVTRANCAGYQERVTGADVRYKVQYSSFF